MLRILTQLLQRAACRGGGHGQPGKSEGKTLKRRSPCLLEGAQQRGQDFAIFQGMELPD